MKVCVDACGHHDDRGRDSLNAGGLDQLPAVDTREHEVEDAYVGFLVPETSEPLVAVRHPDGIEAGGVEVSRHALRDHFVVLDDQHPWHRCHYRGPGSAAGSPDGGGVVKGW